MLDAELQVYAEETTSMLLRGAKLAIPLKDYAAAAEMAAVVKSLCGAVAAAVGRGGGGGRGGRGGGGGSSSGGGSTRGELGSAKLAKNAGLADKVLALVAGKR